MSDIKIGKYILSVCSTNCYYIYREGDDKAIFIDPGDRGEYIYKDLKEKGLEVKAILLTHGHFDHIWGCDELKKLSGAPVYASEQEKELLNSAELNVSDMAGRPCTTDADVYFKDGELLDINGFKIKAIFTPGHTGGSCCFYFEEERILFSGDTLFEESVGRTDFPTGSSSVLGRSLRDKLSILPDETIVYPGHGDATDIGHEKKYNPFWY